MARLERCQFGLDVTTIAGRSRYQLRAWTKPITRVDTRMATTCPAQQAVGSGFASSMSLCTRLTSI